MNRFIIMLLCVVLTIGVFAGCQSTESTPTQAPTAAPTEPKEVAVEVGYGRVAISPDFEIPMRGYGDSSTRYSTNGTDPDAPVYTTCVAFRDEEGNTILLYHNDTIGSGADTYDSIREAVSAATGVPFDHIMTSGTHTHHNIDFTLSSRPEVKQYAELMKNWMVEAAKTAIADLKPAKMYTAKTPELENLNFVRHYLMKDGTYAGDNFGNKSSGYKAHQSDADSVMQLIKFTREGGKDVVLVNWQSHPHRDGGDYNTLSSNIVGIMRNELEGRLDCNFAYFTGASGNVNPKSKFPWENITANYKEQGKALADAAVSAAAGFAQVRTGKLQLVENIFTAEPKEGAASAPDLPLYAFAIGEVAFVTAPYEMFDGNGKQIKQGSPYATTFVITCANDSLSYMPTYESYEYDGMLSYGGSRCKYARGTGEILAEEFVKMLNQLHEAN